MALPFTLKCHEILHKIRPCLDNLLHFRRNAVSLPNYLLSLLRLRFPVPAFDILTTVCSPWVMFCEWRLYRLRLLWSLPCDRRVQRCAAASDLPGGSHDDTFAHPYSFSAHLTTRLSCLFHLFSTFFFSPYHNPLLTPHEYSFKNWVPTSLTLLALSVHRWLN